MPEMDGPTLLKELRNLNPNIKSSRCRHAEEAFAGRGLPDPNQFRFPAQPFTLKHLVAKVKDTMAG